MVDFRYHVATEGTEMRFEVSREDLTQDPSEGRAHAVGEPRTGFSPESIAVIADAMLDWVLSRLMRASTSRGAKPPLIRITVRTQIPHAAEQPPPWQFDWHRDWLPETGPDGFSEFSPSAAQVVGDELDLLLHRQLALACGDGRPAPRKMSLRVDAHVPTRH